MSQSLQSESPKSAPGLLPLDAAFFERPAVDVARGLIGALLTRQVQTDGGLIERRARIVETEAYLGPRDLASHTSRGRTARTETLLGPPATIYVYLIYGLHHMLNVVTGPPGEGHAVLLRAAEPLDDWAVNLTGPGNLARGFEITRALNGTRATSAALRFLLDPAAPPAAIGRAKRVGVDYARHWKDRLLRFYDRRSRSVSKLG